MKPIEKPTPIFRYGDGRYVSCPCGLPGSKQFLKRALGSTAYRSSLEVDTLGMFHSGCDAPSHSTIVETATKKAIDMSMRPEGTPISYVLAQNPLVKDLSIRTSIKLFGQSLREAPAAYPTYVQDRFSRIYVWLVNSILKSRGARYSQLPFPGPPSRPIPRLPTRVLDLYAPDQSTPGSMFRLVHPEDGTAGCYFALSHRWREGEDVLLTSETLEALTSGMDVSNLSTTVRDAITITRALGCRYLWVDTLCIKQDSTEDWLQQSALMADVYHSATCTIALHSVRPETDTLRNNRFSRYVDKSLGLARPPCFHCLVNKTELSSRGWVFQERLLSERILHFSRGDVFLEDASGVLTDVVGDGRITRPLRYSPASHDRVDIEEALAAPASWYRLIEKYSTSNLTYAIDRLPAIYGFAQLISRREGGDAYTFGLFAKSLHQGLLWTECGSESPTRLREAYHRDQVCPSWSWASWTGRIAYPRYLESFESRIEVCGSSSENEHKDILSDPWQEASSKLGPQIHVTTLSFKAELIFFDNVEVTCRPETLNAQGERRPRCAFKRRDTQKLLGYADFDGLRCPGPRSGSGAGPSAAPSSTTMFFPKVGLALIARHEAAKRLRLTEADKADAEEVFEQDFWAYQYHYYFLVVREVEGGRFSVGRYVRLGMGRTAVGDWWDGADRMLILLE